MKILAIESSTALGSVAILNDGRVLSEERSQIQRQHSELMNVLVDKTLSQAGMQLSEIDIFSCGLGPGSFTGIRVAANIAKSFCYLLQKPLVAIDSLTLLSQQNKFSGYKLCAINAFKNMVYMAIFNDQNPVTSPMALPLKSLEEHLLKTIPDTESFFVIGDGAELVKKSISPSLCSRLKRDKDSFDYPLASQLASTAEIHAKSGQTIEWKNYLPLYIRASEAEENLTLS